MTRDELVTSLTTRADDAERISALAPVSVVLRDVLTSLSGLDGIPSGGPDQLIELEEAGARLAVSPRWLREQRPPYVVQLGDKTLRVSTRKLERFLSSAGR
jgi:hypothetical protein